MRVVSLLFHDVFASDPGESGFRSPAADRYKLSIPDFEAQLDSLDLIGTQLTFDDGGISYYTIVAERLESLGLRAHCFVSTDFIGERGFLTEAQIRELDARDHVIGSHSASHPARFNCLPYDRMRKEWCDSRARLEDLLGHEVTVASIPGGYFSTDVARAAAEAGFRKLFTSEPTRKVLTVDGCALVGRFVIRSGHPHDMAKRFAAASSSARCRAWVDWNAKALVKPLLGPAYARIADWILAPRSVEDHG